MGKMVRANIVLDEALVARVMETYGLATKRAAVDLALRAVAADGPHGGMLALEGSGWIGDLDAIRRSSIEDPSDDPS